MSKQLLVEVVVEGQTENAFVKQVLAPYWSVRGIFVEAPVYRTHVDMRSGTIHKGGDIRFTRLMRQLGSLLRQRRDTIIANFVGFYGIRQWPALDKIQTGQTPEYISQTLCHAAKEEICHIYPENNPQKRYFPFIAVHEFEALLFSDANILSKNLNIPLAFIENVLTECANPEAIDNSPQTAPFKRLETWTNGSYIKKIKGISLAQAIGIDKMRNACPNFDEWLKSIEALQEEL